MIGPPMTRLHTPEHNDTDESSSSSSEDEKRSWYRHITWTRALVLSVVVCMACVIAGYGHYRDPGPLPEKTIVVIPQGGIVRVAQTLQQHTVLASGWSSALFFRAAAFLSVKDGDIHAAEFEFPARASIAHVLLILRHGRPVTHSLTIPEGLTAYHIRDVLQKAVSLQGEVPDIAEGSVFPQTFFYRWGEQRSSLLKKMQDLMTRHLTHVWEKRDVSSLEGSIETPQNLLILASLVERETALPEERPRVARVFLNRLKKHMRLQTDPTVIYALSEGKGSLDRRLSHEDLGSDSPYNTYKNAGLPPGPICSPSLQSLEAVAHPSSGDDLYFVATGQGGHAFSRSFSEHTQHVRTYRKSRSAP